MKKHLANRTNLFEELLNFPVFCEVASGLRLRSYQQAAGEAILNAIFEQLGRTLVVIFPRQSGKNELPGPVRVLPAGLPAHQRERGNQDQPHL